MTEAEWLASDDPGAMLRYLQEVARPRTEEGGGGVPGTSDRKLRLWVAACRQAIAPGRTNWGYDLDEPEDLPGAVADWSRRDNEDDHGTAASRADLLRDIVGNPFRPVQLEPCSRCDGDGEAHGSDRPFQWSGPGSYPGPCPVCQGRRSPWVTPTVLSIAQGAYDHRDEVSGHLDPVRLAILADALEEVGCMPYGWCRLCAGPPSRTRLEGEVCVAHDEDLGPHPVLEHLRSPGPHVRGCWTIDLILGKE